jgi:predicted metal-dependent phosphotriesterase family hydrolase
MIQTVLGAIQPDELGICLPHEHIWCDQNLAPRKELFGLTRSTASYMCLNNYDLMVEELIAFKQQGGGAIVEVTCDGWGRDLEILAKLSRETKVHIIATAGYYIEPCIPYYVDEMSIGQLADHMIREIKQGVGDSTRKCGVLKSAIHRARVEGIELKVLRAVAIAQKATGVSITTHTTGGRRQEVPGGTVGVHQLQILKEEGVDPSRLIVGHTDERPDIDVLSQLANEGCYIQFDVIGKEHWLLDSTRAELVQALIARGYVTKLLLSQDRNRDHEMRYSGNTGYCHIFESFLPRLRSLGISQDDINTMLIHNPARAFNHV